MEGEIPEFVKKMFPNGPPPHLKEKYPNGPPPEIIAMLMKSQKPAPGAEKQAETTKETQQEAQKEASKEQAPTNPSAGSPPAKIPGLPPFITPEMFADMMKLGIKPPRGIITGKEREEREKKMESMKNDIYSYKYNGEYPDNEGYFGIFGGICEVNKKIDGDPTVFIKERINCSKLIKEYFPSDEFRNSLREIRRNFQGRPTPLYECKRVEEMIRKNNNGKSGRIFIKREDLNHTGAHKINHCMAEALMAKKLGRTCLCASTAAGQHGLAVATAAAHFGLDCKVFMGTLDIAKEHPNVTKMKVLGAEIIPVDFGGKSLKEANDVCLMYFKEHADTTFQCIGSAVANHPWPYLIREFQKCIGEEAREQILEQTGKLPNHIVACLGGGSNSIGTFTAFLDNKDVKLYPVEPLGKGTKFGEHSACLLYGHRGALQGTYSYVLQDENGEYKSHSVASGLCYPSVGPEIAFLKEIERTIPCGATDHEALESFFLLSKIEGIIPALESAHGFVQAIKLAKQYPDDIILCTISGRGDKDVDYVVENFPEYVNKREFDLLKC